MDSVTFSDEASIGPNSSIQEDSSYTLNYTLKPLKTRTELTSQFRKQMILEEKQLEMSLYLLSKDQLRTAHKKKRMIEDMNAWLKNVQTTTLTLNDLDMEGDVRYGYRRTLHGRRA